MLLVTSLAAVCSSSSGRLPVPRVDIAPCGSLRKEALPLATPFGKPPQQQANGSVCHNASGLLVTVDAIEAHVVSPYTACNSPVFLGSCTFEFFASPVKAEDDAPTNYFEINAAPSAAMFVLLNSNPRGNASTCSGDACRQHKLGCSGRGTYPPYSALGFGARPRNTSSGWSNELFVPFALFADFISGGAGWPTWRLNLYRYGYPDAPIRVPCDPHWGGAGCQNFSNFELSAWSPTYADDFHVPKRFGFGRLVDAEGRPLYEDGGWRTK